VIAYLNQSAWRAPSAESEGVGHGALHDVGLYPATPVAKAEPEKAFSFGMEVLIVEDSEDTWHCSAPFLETKAQSYYRFFRE
jgi:hypothetical protein